MVTNSSPYSVIHQIHHQICHQFHHQIWWFTKFVTKFGDKFVTKFVTKHGWVLHHPALILTLRLKHFGFMYLRIFVLVYFCIFVFYIWYVGMSNSLSLNPMHFKIIAHVGSFKHFVFVYLRIYVFGILHLIHGNVIFDILESHAFKKYSTCWVF